MGGAKPISFSHYLLPQAYIAMVKKEIGDFLRAGIIRVSRNPWIALILLVPRKTGHFALQNLNAMTHSDPLPMPKVNDLIKWLGGGHLHHHIGLDHSSPRCQGKDCSHNSIWQIWVFSEAIWPWAGSIYVPEDDELVVWRCATLCIGLYGRCRRLQ